MPINPIVLQRRLVEVGRIRLGAKKVSAKGKQYPAKLEQFRLTSRDKQRLDAAAVLYGGSVAEWEGQWELFTDADSIPVVVVPGQALSQSFELWGQKPLAGGKKTAVICLRRCDGVTEQLTGEPCLCEREPEMSCKPTTRLSVVLTEVPGLGVWRCESHGWNAAAELAGGVALLEALVASGRPVRARLRLDKRESKTETETRQFVVPVIDIDHTLGEVLAVAGGPAPAALEVGGNGASFTPVPVNELAAEPSSSIAEQVAAGRPERARRSNAAAPIPPTGLPPRGGLDVPEDDAGSPDEGSAVPASQRVAIAARDAGLDDDGRHDLAEYVSDGRSRSSKDLNAAEVVRALEVCVRIRAGSARLDRDDDGRAILRDARFGWKTDPGPAPAAASAGVLSADEIAAMSGRELADALIGLGLSPGGTVEELRVRLMGACGVSGEEPYT